MNPTEPYPGPPEDGTDPNAMSPDTAELKPWHTPQEQHEDSTGPAVVDAGGTGDVFGAAADVGGGAIDLAGGAAAMADAAGGALEGAGSALEVAGGCLEGCGGCSLALLLTLFVAAGTAMALAR